MKKQLFRTAKYVAVIAMLVLSSCGSDDSGSNGSSSGGGGGGGDSSSGGGGTTVSDAMTSFQQKKKIEDVATKMMKLTPASDFKNISGLMTDAKRLAEYETDDIEEWAKLTFETMLHYVGQEKKETYRYEYDWNDEHNIVICYDLIKNYNALVAISDFNGHFTANDVKREWQHSGANDLQFIFNDSYGKKCILSLKASGATKNMYVGTMSQHEDIEAVPTSDQVPDNVFDNVTIYNDYLKKIKTVIKVPEHINLSLTQNGQQIVCIDLDINLGKLTGEYFDLSETSLTLNAKAKVNNYVFNLKQFAYNAGSSATAQFEAYKGNTKLMTVNVSSDLTDIPGYLFTEDEDPLFGPGVEPNAKNAAFKIDILGEMQIQGTVADTRRYVEYLDMARKNNDQESTSKSYINQANGLSKIYLYYDNKSTKQAYFILKAFEREDPWSWGRIWKAEPVVCFQDGSSYDATFKVFFNERDFRNVIRRFQSLADGYRNLYQ